MDLIKLDEIKEISRRLDKSKVKNMCKLINANSDLVFDNREICKIYNSNYPNKLEINKSSTILSRLFRKGMLLRTKTQLRDGYFYSLNNEEELFRLYDEHLLPYDFDNRKYILDLITKNAFEKLAVNEEIKSYPPNSDFIDKYGMSYFLNERVKTFMAINLGFLMCDGHITKNMHQMNYFFNQKEDAESFKSDCLSIFNKERLSLKYHQFCFKVGICNKSLAMLFNSLGVPKGNKVFQPFLAPNWIYYGPNSIKRAFLSTIYGNEGSKPQDNRWRIQFVLSKAKEHVPNLLQFLNQIRTMLNHFDISTSHIQLREQKRRAFCSRFYIKGKENLIKFHEQIGFLYASEKQEVLESLISGRYL